MAYLLALLLCASTAVAELKPVRIQFVRVVDGATMSRAETLRVTKKVREAYLKLRLVFTFSGLRQVRVGFGPGLVADRLNYARRVERRVRGRTRGYRTHVFVPMSTDGYSWGYAFGPVSVGTATSYNLRGEPRFWHTVTTAAHEIGHLLGADHDDREPNLMHSNALAFVNNNVPRFPWWMRDIVLSNGFGVDMCDYTFVPCLIERPTIECQSKSQ
jgi:hypothetical protein